tara:strand:+ start:1030 stop:1188 length:159 start_codon:yes stop_codon:yes gene_type:complete
MRVTTSGHVLGIDLGVALQIAKARGADLLIMSELLQAAEPGLVEALNTREET